MYDSKELHVNGESIKLRLTQEMKKWLFEKAARDHTTVSHIMRSLIYAEMQNKQNNSKNQEEKT